MRNLPQAHLTLVGDGPLRSKLTQLVDELNLTHRVHFVGTVAQKSLPAFYNSAEVLILASAREGMPNVVLESLACGTPVIGTRIGGIPEVVEEPRVGVLMDRRTPEDLVAAYGALSENRPRRDDIRQYSMRFNWSAIARKQLALYQNILKGGL